MDLGLEKKKKNQTVLYRDLPLVEHSYTILLVVFICPPSPNKQTNKILQCI